MRSRQVVLLAMVLATVASLAWGQTQKALTNQDVTDMVKQGMNEALILKVIQASDTNFDTSQDAIAQLKTGGVTPNVLDAMAKARSSKNQPPAAQAAANSSATPAAPAAPTAEVASVATPAPVNNASPSPADAGAKYTLKEGTEIPLKFANDLNSKTANEGDTVELTLTEDLKVGDVVVAKEGARAVAVVSNAKKAGMMGKPGELNIQLQHMTVNGSRIRVRGTKGREGDSKTGTAVALTVLFGPIGLIKHGKNVEVKAGTPLTAYVDEDISLPPAT